MLLVLHEAVTFAVKLSLVTTLHSLVPVLTSAQVLQRGPPHQVVPLYSYWDGFICARTKISFALWAW